MAARIAVIGGGIAGLAAARRLVEAGVDAVVLESAARAGGVLGTSTADGFAREHAATAVLAGSPDGLVDLAGELGVAMEAAAPAAKQRWIWIDGALKALPRGPLSFARSDLLTWRGKLELMKEPLRRGRDVARAGDESVYDFAVRRLGPEAARALIAPMVTGIYAADAHEVSLAAGFPKLAALDAQGGLIRGMIGKMVRGGRGGGGANGASGGGGAAAGGAKKKGKQPRGLWAPVEGMQAIIDALAAQLGPRLRLGQAVTAVTPGPRGVAVEVGDGPAARRLDYDGAVLAVPASAAARLVRASVPALATALDGFVRAPVAIVYLGYERSAVMHGEGGFGFLVAQGEALRVLGCVMESVVWPQRAPGGKALLRCIFGGGRDPEACRMSDAELIARARADVAQALAMSPDVAPVHASVVRWDEGIAQVAVGHADRVASVDGLARAQRLVVAGAGFHGVAVNDLVADARRVVAEVKAWGG